MKINNNWFLKPSVSAVYVKQENISGQANLCLFFKNIFWIEGGYKTSKSVVLSTGFNISKIGIAYSYETNSTAISNIGGSTHEIMLTYGFGGRKNNPLKDTIPIIADSLVDNRMKHTIGNKTYEEYIMSNNYGFYNDVLDLTDSMRREEVKKIEIQKIKEKQDSIIVADSIKQNPVQQLSQSEYDILKRGIHFDLNSAVLSKASRNYLDSVVVLMNINQKIKILITGFTCDLGSKEANEKYSKMRADAVKYYLESKGIASDRITTDSKADAQPVVPNTSEINREQNRRIDFSILRE
jgi:outer membrane protein OmpA-like peptidoglycan-associated protein